MATASAGVIAMMGPLEGIGQLTWITRDGRRLHTVGDAASQLGVELSPDGQQVATHRAGEIWTTHLTRPVLAPVTRGGPHRHPVWSPDGLQIATLFQGGGLGSFELWTTILATGRSEIFGRYSGLVKPVGWLHDGRLVWIQAGATGLLESSIWMKAATGAPVLFVRDGAAIPEARASRDGRWIAFASERSGRFEIEVGSLAEPGRRFPVSVGGGGFPRWRADGRELYFISADGHLMAASFEPGMPPKIGVPAPLFEVSLIAHPDRGTFAAYEYDVSPDGSQFLVNRMVTPPDANMTVIVDWNPPR